jgi:cobalt-zinc-cadmium efflux system membrane fusion protein
MFNMRKNSLITAAFISTFLIIMTSCTGGKDPAAETKEAEVIPEDIVEMRNDQVKFAGIETNSLEMKSLNGELKVSGIVTVAPQNLATVCMPMGGFIKSIALMPGNPVSKGQTLAILENQDFIDIQQNYLEARNRLEYAQAEFTRHTELYKEDVYSQKNLQQVTADYNSLKAQVNALEQKLALIGINPANLTDASISRSVALVSPITGYVNAVNVNIGKFVSPSDILFEIINSDRLLLELTLYEKDADKVAIDQTIRFFINNETEQHEAVIYQTGKSISNDKTYKVYASVNGGCKNIFPGMYVNAIIESAGNEATALPSEAIVTFDDKDYIFIFDRNKEENGKQFTEYRMIEVKKGVTDGGYTGVILPEGFDIKNAKVVVKGAYNLLSAKRNAGEMSC